MTGGWSDALHEAAVIGTGLTDFGDGTYQAGLDVLLRSVDDEIPHARDIASAFLIPHLQARLLTEQGWKEMPQASARSTKAPLIIIGLPRSGTTALHKLISADLQFQGLESWLCWHPMPRPARDKWAEVPVYREFKAQREASYANNPKLRTAHAVDVDEVDECLVPLSQQFSSNLFVSMLGTRAFTEWHEASDEVASYSRFKDIMQLVSSTEPDPARRWLLKNPGHTYNIDALLNAFPDALIVQTHRNTAAIVASVSSVLATMRGMMLGDVDVAALARREMRYWSEAARRTMAAQDRRPERFFNVDYRAFVADPMASVRTIYNRFGLTLEPSAERAMHDWIAANPQNKHGRHTYALVDFGLDDADLKQSFGDYTERYAL